MPRYLHDVRACDLVVPRLAFRILQNPEPAEPEHRKRKDPREASHQPVNEPQRLTVRTNDSELADDPADRRAFPGPEPDVIREHQDEPPLFDPASVKIQQLHSNRDEQDVENERR